MSDNAPTLPLVQVHLTPSEGGAGLPLLESILFDYYTALPYNLINGIHLNGDIY
jgi:hypothetical protein